VVAVHHVNHSIRPGDDRVISMFAFPFELLQEMNFVRVKLIIAIRINQAIQPRAFRSMSVHVKTVMRVKHTHRLAQRRGNRLKVRDLSLTVQRDAQQRLLVILRRNNQSALGINRHGNPRPLLRFGRTQQFHFEPRRHNETFGGGG
jgi:hypothetical protein